MSTFLKIFITCRNKRLSLQEVNSKKAILFFYYWQTFYLTSCVKSITWKYLAIDKHVSIQQHSSLKPIAQFALNNKKYQS